MTTLTYLKKQLDKTTNSTIIGLAGESYLRTEIEAVIGVKKVSPIPEGIPEEDFIEEDLIPEEFGESELPLNSTPETRLVQVSYDYLTGAYKFKSIRE